MLKLFKTKTEMFLKLMEIVLWKREESSKSRPSTYPSYVAWLATLISEKNAFFLFILVHNYT